MGEIITIDGNILSFACLKQSLLGKSKCKLAKDVLASITASHQVIQNVIATEQTVYGINTGFGSLANQRISAENLRQLQRNVVLSHACGTGDLLDDATVGLILLLKINSLAQGYSGVSVTLIEALITLYNHGIYPCIPGRGSVGASGDLAPLAHMALPLLGVGNVRYQGKIITAEEGLALAGVPMIELGPKEGLALLNGLQASTAIALTAYFHCERLFDAAIIAGALSVDAACGSDIPFDDRIQQARGQPAQMDAAKLYRDLLRNSPIRESHRHCLRVQDPYSLRCQPQVLGAVLHQMRFVAETLLIEANAVTDNPLVFVADNEILSGGNFHGEIVAMAADNLALAIAEMGAISERRIALLMDKNFSGLPAYLVKEGGINSGFMVAHVTAVACASDNKALAHPHSVDSLPTSGNQEDHVSMATNSARRLHPMLDNTMTILAIELLAACQGLEFHSPLCTSPQLLVYYEKLREQVKSYDQDRFFAPDLATVKQMIMDDQFLLTRKK